MRSSLHVAFVFLSLLLLIAANADQPEKNGDATAYIVFVVRPPEGTMGEDHEAYHIHFLTLVLGSEEAARKALVYNYDLISGFAAWLTKKQASELSKQPGVLRVMPDRTTVLFSEGSSSHQPDVFRA